jgi:heme/copper-type cytochrome/quinol oxidase subunit 2
MTKNKEKKPKFKSMTFWMMVIILVIVMLAFIFSIVKYANERRDYSDNRFYLNPAIS